MESGSGALLLFLAALYFLPTLFAGARGRRNTIAIFALNLFLGWTLIGWVMSLVWALSREDRQPVVTQQVMVAPPPAAPASKPEKQKRCFACAEWILQDAIKCKHCGEIQANRITVGAAEPGRPAAIESPQSQAPATAPPPVNQSVSIAHWTSGLPSAKAPDGSVDWSIVRHSDRNIGRQK